MKKLLLLVMAVMLVGCATPIIDNNANMSKLSAGMTKAQVLEVMGPAGKTEAYGSRRCVGVFVLSYRKAMAHSCSDLLGIELTEMLVVESMPFWAVATRP
jgi:hypothetical protein